MKILKLNNKTIELYQKCFELNGNKKNKKVIEWQLLNNSIKKSFVDIAYDNVNNRTAGIYAASCVKFLIDNDIYIGAQSLDTITDIEYRGKGLFTSLANDVYDKMIESNIALVYGFPNKNSIHGFEKKLGWEKLDPIPFLIRPLNTKYFTQKINFLKYFPNIKIHVIGKKNNKFKIKEEFSFSNDVNLLWKKFSSNFKVAVNRDFDYLKWRYLDKPNENYKILHAYYNNEYVGFIVFTIKEKHEGQIGYIMELITDPAFKDVDSLLLNKALLTMKNKAVDLVLAWSFKHSPNYRAFKKNLFFNFLEKLRPIELHFGMRIFKKDLKNIVENRKNWYLSYSDSDTV